LTHNKICLISCLAHLTGYANVFQKKEEDESK